MNLRSVKAGAITAKSESRASMSRRQRLIVSQVVSPGGKNLCLQQKPLQQQGRQQLGLPPGSRCFVIKLGDMPGAHQAFQSFEGKLALPATTIELQHLTACKFRRQGS